MSTLTMTEQMKKTLDTFFAGKTINDVDRNTYQVCNLNDNRIKLTISLVFMRDWDSIETDNYNSVILENKGVVFTFPCYWISVPKELSMTYFEYIINNFYEAEVAKWSIASGLISEESSDSTGTGNGCACNNSTGQPVQSPPCQYIAQNI